MSANSRNFLPTLRRNVTPTASGSEIVSYTSDLGNGGPILTLIHGYPQSAFIWRNVVPVLLPKVSLFIPELPGYGISTAAAEHSKLAVGTALLEALRTAFSITAPRKLVLGGHDRGARISHRLAVSRASLLPTLDVVGTVLIDIVPTKAQWDSFADPAIAAGYFHWPLLANVELAVVMLRAYGGGRWCRRGHAALAGTNAEGVQRLNADGAVDVYASLFEKEETLRASCEDYKAGAGVDVQEQVEDQAAGRKLEVPTLVMFSQVRLGARTDVAAVWRDWIKDGVPYVPVPVGNGYGHYLPEEAYDVVAEQIISFLDNYI